MLRHLKMKAAVVLTACLGLLSLITYKLERYFSWRPSSLLHMHVVLIAARGSTCTNTEMHRPFRVLNRLKAVKLLCFAGSAELAAGIYPSRCLLILSSWRSLSCIKAAAQAVTVEVTANSWPGNMQGQIKFGTTAHLKLFMTMAPTALRQVDILGLVATGNVCLRLLEVHWHSCNKSTLA